MKREELQEGWRGLSEEIMNGIAEWREQHPKATFREIEEEIDQRLSGLRAKMLSDTAMRSAQTEWEGSEDYQEGEEETDLADAGWAGSEAGSGICGPSGVWAGDFPPG